MGETRERLTRSIHDLGRVAVNAHEPAAPCPVCDGPMRVQKTGTRLGMTLEHGSFVARETTLVCSASCQWPSGALVTRRAEALAERLMPQTITGYDVMVFVGLRRFIHHRQREEIRAELLQHHGLQLSTGEVSRLTKVFLAYLERLHRDRAPAIRAVFEGDGGWPLHVDATGEDGRGTLLAIFAGWRQWVLGAWKIPTEHADAVLPHLRATVADFGPPCAFMRDLGHAVTRAIERLNEELALPTPIPVLACHAHFLRDVGKDLLEPAYRQLQCLFRRFKLCPTLRALARDLGRKLGGGIDEARFAVTQWQSAEGESHLLPEGAAGLAAVRAVVQWVLDYPSAGNDQGFPFDRPYLDLFERCAQARRAADAFLRTPPRDRPVRAALERLHAALSPTVSEVPFVQLAATLTRRAGLFDELRDALRLHAKPSGRNEAASAIPGVTDAAVTELRDVKQAVEALVAELRERRPQRGPAQDTRAAIDLVLRHVDKHGATLWGHAIALPDTAGTGGGVRLVDRTNNVLEGLFHAIKHGERRRSGRKVLTQDFESLPPAAVLTPNLSHADYVQVLCGSLDQLPRAFAKLDAAASERARRVPKDPASGSTGTIAPPPEPPFAATASLPKEDRGLIRTDAMRQRVLAAAGSRAPWQPGGPADRRAATGS